MAAEPENLTHRLLREICAKQDEQSDVLTQHTRRLSDIEDRLEAFQHEMTYALGLGTRSIVKHKEQDARLNELFAKVEELLTKA